MPATRQLRTPTSRSWCLRISVFGFPSAFGLRASDFTFTAVPSRDSLPLVRRPTGGGLVPHDADWTYSLAFPPGDAWYSLSATDSYRRVHEWIQAAFARLGLATDLAPSCLKTQAGQCFAGWEKFDVLWRGQKVAGAAQRRTRDGLLIQGSVQPPRLSQARANWEQAMCDEGCSGQGAKWVEFKPDAPLAERAQELVRQKYSQASYNQKR